MKLNFYSRQVQALTLLFFGFMTSQSQASVFTLPTLETSQTEAVFKTLGSTFAFRPLEGASDLGAIWGLYIGVGGGGTRGTDLAGISSDTPEYLPNAELHVGLGLPLGFTLEAGVLPSLSYKGTSTSKYGGAVKWTATRTILNSLPFSLAARVGYSQGKINWSQPLNSGTVAIGYQGEMMETQVAASKMFGALGLGVEPFVGLGYISHSSKLAGTGTANLFGTSFPGGTTSVNGTNGSVWAQAGFMVHLIFLGISAEYDNMFGISSYNAKLTLRM